MSAANENTLTIKVRSQDPVGEYEFSVCKTVRFIFSFGFVSLSLSLSLSSRERNSTRLPFPEKKLVVVTLRERERERDFHFFIDRDNARSSSEIETRFHEEDAVSASFRNFSLSFLFFRVQSPFARGDRSISSLPKFVPTQREAFFFVFFSSSLANRKIDFLTDSFRIRTDENPRFEETGGNQIRGETVRTAHFVPRTVGRGRYELIFGAGGE